jgi:hypothetical protein
MTDKELLELAAKAAGIAIVPCTCNDERWPFKHEESVSGKRGLWNPLNSDGDAFRLAVVCAIDVTHRFVGGRRVEALAPCGQVYVEWFTESDSMVATRRAIVRAAAAIGQSMEKPV